MTLTLICSYSKVIFHACNAEQAVLSRMDVKEFPQSVGVLDKFKFPSFCHKVHEIINIRLIGNNL